MLNIKNKTYTELLIILNIQKKRKIIEREDTCSPGNCTDIKSAIPKRKATIKLHQIIFFLSFSLFIDINLSTAT